MKHSQFDNRSPNLRASSGKLYGTEQAKLELLRTMVVDRTSRRKREAEPQGVGGARVFVLGAGFSKCAGLPLAREFFSRWMDWIEQIDSKEVRSLRTRIRVFAYTQLSERRGWRSFQGTSWDKDIDIERLLTLAEATAAYWRVISAPKDRVAQGIVELHKLLPEYFKRSVGMFLYAITMSPHRGWSAVIDFCERLRPGDTVVTFNWDTILENVLTAMEKPFDLSGETPGQISLLKLHGSIDWVSGKPPIREAAQFTKPVVRNIWRVANYAPFVDLVGEWFVPYIIPPTAYKHYEPGILALWKRASVAIFGARKVFIIGYSMPLTDWASISLLRLPFRPEVADAEGRRSNCRELIVVNPKRKDANRFKKLVFPASKWIGKEAGQVRWSRYL